MLKLLLKAALVAGGYRILDTTFDSFVDEQYFSLVH